MVSNYEKIFYRDYERLQSENAQLIEKNRTLSDEGKRLQKIYEIERAENERNKARIQALEEAIQEAKAQNEALKKEVARLNAIINLDGTNSGTPTSKTPLNKKKVIPNSRRKTGAKKGGQPGHPKSKLKAFTEDEVTEDAIHGYNECPACGGELKRLPEESCKDELDYEVVVVKRRHHYPVYECTQCGKRFRRSIPERLKEENQYGARTQALALSLMNVGNVSMNKVRRIICGLSQGEVNPTEGYIAKVQRRAAEALDGFMQQLRKECLQLDTLYWDDTVIFISAKRACLRFYGNEKLALYFAHSHKDKVGIDEDNILPLLPASAHVMHDHNIVNYNDDYSFTNIECNEHLLRDLQKVTDNLQRQWSKDMKEHIQKAIHDRNEVILAGKKEFDNKYIEDFFSRFNLLIIQANQEHMKSEASYYYSEEAALILRMLEYKDNYFAWVCCFDLPVTNNLSERSLRGSKTHLKVSGQFITEAYAQYYATIQSYIETCKRNAINEMSALIRLCEGNPYTVEEIFNAGSDDE